TQPEEVESAPRTAVAVADSEPQQVRQPKKEKSASRAPRAEQTPEVISAPLPSAVPETPKGGSAATRLAARRQASQRSQQRSAAALITPEHFAYVRKDLITIAILASVMFAAIIILYFVFGSIL